MTRVWASEPLPDRLQRIRRSAGCWATRRGRCGGDGQASQRWSLWLRHRGRKGRPQPHRRQRRTLRPPIHSRRLSVRRRASLFPRDVAMKKQKQRVCLFALFEHVRIFAWRTARASSQEVAQLRALPMPAKRGGPPANGHKCYAGNPWNRPIIATTFSAPFAGHVAQSGRNSPRNLC